jgi:hypothetical protein
MRWPWTKPKEEFLEKMGSHLCRSDLNVAIFRGRISRRGSVGVIGIFVNKQGVGEIAMLRQLVGRAVAGTVGPDAFSVYLLLIVRSYNPTRRNRNIGTAKSGHGQDNRMTIPDVSHGESIFWEKIEGAKEIIRIVSGKPLKFYVQPTRADCVHACTVDDIARLMSHVPVGDWEGLDAIVLRQARRKEQMLEPVWGRLAYAADLVNQHRQVLYSGPAIIIEAVNPAKPFRFGKSLSSDGRAELDRLKTDGHKLRPGDRNNTIVLTLESCRATQLYRTLPHELGHWVDFLQKVEHPAAALPNLDTYGELVEQFHRRPSREREEFAHSYAERLARRLLATDAIPFDRLLDREQLLKDHLHLDDFYPTRPL